MFDYSQNPAPVPRTMRVLLAPHLPPDSLNYYIDSSGVHGIMDEDDNTLGNRTVDHYHHDSNQLGDSS